MSPRIGLDLPTIIQAAAEMADTQGVDEVTLASLAGKLKIRPPSLYNHVNGLHDLRKKLAIHGLEQLRIVLTRAAVGRAGDEAVRALGEAYVAFAKTHPGLYEATLRAPEPQDPDVQKAGAEIVDLVVRVLRAYDLEGEAALHAVRGLRSILHGFASLEQRGGFGLPLDLHVSLRFLLDTFLAGIHKMKPGGKTFG
ncbi:TetR-like C-terminal domain-containing protein [Paenibacillus naphthalenovorans]|uniref:TetR-like C-terminal domain-containing protein n=1 Tax=Paenibacillus naphthalenovorans TaxID=162209 RepID=UPI00087EB8FE|nr:TetR/AcrR family transcriptional regulator [Paenibacillus naphthalenovorans]SDI31290.1 DNA-binding transcriptional regulator, AcrR family [Paenibacillus naphthalenovorans]